MPLLLALCIGCAHRAPPPPDYAARAEALRAEVGEALQEKIAETPDGQARAPLLHRLCEQRLDEGQRVYSAELTAWEREFERAFEAGDPILSAVPAPPSSQPSAAFVDAALACAAVLVADPDYPRGDEALMALYTALDRLVQPALAEEALVLLVERDPDSPLAGQAWVILGEQRFAAQRLAEALAAFDAALAAGGSYSRYAAYKRAWTLVMLDREDEAVAAMEALLASLAGSAAQTDQRLREEAARDLLGLLINAGRPGEAADAALRWAGSPEEARRALTRLAQQLDGAGFEEEAAAVRGRARALGADRPQDLPAPQ